MENQLYIIEDNIQRNFYIPMLKSLKIGHLDIEFEAYCKITKRYAEYTSNYMPFKGIKYIYL